MPTKSKTGTIAGTWILQVLNVLLKLIFKGGIFWLSRHYAHMQTESLYTLHTLDLSATGIARDREPHNKLLPAPLYIPVTC